MVSAATAHCRFCGHPVGNCIGALPGYRYGDGTITCSSCHVTAVKTDPPLAEAWRFVVGSCQGLGLDARWGDIRVRLRNAPDLVSMAGQHTVVGLTRSWWCGPTVESDITVLYGMPWSHVVLTLAHEAGHVWCHKHRVTFAPEEAEEGFANVVACLVLTQVARRFRPQDCLDALFANPDPVYGGWLRSEWQRMTSLTWRVYLEELRKDGVKGALFRCTPNALGYLQLVPPQPHVYNKPSTIGFSGTKNCSRILISFGATVPHVSHKTKKRD